MTPVTIPNANTLSMQNAYFDIVEAHEEALEVFKVFADSLESREFPDYDNIADFAISKKITEQGKKLSTLQANLEIKVKRYIKNGGSPLSMAKVFCPNDHKKQSQFVKNELIGRRNSYLNVKEFI